MRSRLSLAAALLLLATASSAGPLNMRWGGCFGDGGTFNRNFACDTNSGFEDLVCSFVPPGPITGVVGMQAVLRFVFAGATIPPWWQFQTTGSCRTTSMGVMTTLPASAASCIDFSDGVRNFLSSYSQGISPNYAQLTVISPTAPAGPFDLLAGQEYFALTVRINHQKTVGTGSCGGCSMGACMGLMGVNLVRTPNSDIELRPVWPNDQVAAWQGAAGIGVPNYGGTGFFYCPGATPTHRSTWGDVKALYR